MSRPNYLTDAGTFNVHVMAAETRRRALADRIRFGDHPAFRDWPEGAWHDDAFATVLRDAQAQQAEWQVRHGVGLVEVSPAMAAELSTDVRPVERAA